MKRHLLGTAGAFTALILAAGCAEDPVDSLRGGVVRVQGSKSYVELQVGQTTEMFAQAFDEQGNAILPLPTVASMDEGIATVEVDNRISGNPVPETNFSVTAIGAGTTDLMYESSGVSGSTTIVSFPTAFDGAVSVAASGGFDVVTISGTSVLGFAPTASAAFNFGSAAAYTRSVSASALELIVDAVSDVTLSEVTINDLLFLGDKPLASLSASISANVAAPTYVANGTPGAGTDLTAGPFPLTMFVVLDGTNVDDFFTVAPSADLDITVNLDWSTGEDIDLLWCDAACASFVGNFDGATGANPEHSSVTVPGGAAWNLWLNYYAGAGPALIRVVITSP